MGKSKNKFLSFLDREKALSKNKGHNVRFLLRKQEEDEAKKNVEEFLLYPPEQPEERDDPV